MKYWVKTSWWLKQLFPKGIIWSMPVTDTPTVYLTFDDGPHPTATPYALQQLALYNATATFFCIGKNVVEHPDIYKEIVAAGHTTANHTHNHVDGWKLSPTEYLDNIALAEEHIQGHLFRPPYGHIRPSQVKRMLRSGKPWRIYMWDVLSADFDRDITPQQCLDNVLQHMQPGTIVIFHDSEKAWDRMSYALPLVLQHCKQQNWQVKALPLH
jgi:hypothetical protein